MKESTQRRTIGKDMEIFELMPVILGGDPVNPKNKIVLTRDQHIEAVVYWNGIVKDLREKQNPRPVSAPSD